jgi:hypothetical protein
MCTYFKPGRYQKLSISACRLTERGCAGVALLLLLSFCFSGICAAVDFDVSYTPLGNGGAENGTAGWFSQAAASVQAPCPEGSRCFQLACSGDSVSELRSSLLAVRRNESLRLVYHLKISAGTLAGDSGGYAAVRSYKQDKTTVITESRFDLHDTQAQWLACSHDLTVAPGAYYVDVRFVFKNAKPDSDVSKTIQVDAISVFREIRYNPLYADIKPLSAGDGLYVFTKGRRSENNQAIAIQTLQGVISRTDRPRLYIDTGDNTFLNHLSENYKIQFDWRYAGDFPALLGELKKYSSGRYVLYDMNDKPSISAATTMAGLLDAVAMDTKLEATAISKGYVQVMDVRGKDCRWVYENYRDQLNDEAVVVHTNDERYHRSASYLRDWSPATKALCWWYADEAYSREVYRSMAPCSPVYGWHDPTTSDEGQSVKMHSEEGLFQIPSDWMANLSVHASMGRAMKDRKFTQKVSREKPVRESSVHYVTFILSDMDNILTEIGSNSFYSQPKFYRNPHRGQFPMSWGMAPSLVELSPAGIDLWYSHATPKDVFVAYCGLGYFYPSVAPYMQTHMKRLSEFMERADLRTILLIDRLLPEADLTDDYYEKAKWFTSLNQVRGLFYLEYVKYAPHGGKIFWFDNKPMVTARFDFRDESFYPAVRSTASALARSINELPKDPASPEGYTFVTVHAWSKGLDDIYDTIQLLDPKVRVVDAEAFIELVRQNLKPSSQSSKPQP